MKTATERLASLDAFRGFDILVMIFVNYIAFMKGVPFILQHAKAEMDAFTLTDVVFPGFLFIVGVAIPLSLEKRMALGDPLQKIMGRVLLRTAGLLFLGTITVNERWFSAPDTGMSQDLWSFLAYTATILLWMTYPRTESRPKRNLYLGMRIAAAPLLLGLVLIFRGRTDDGTIHGLQHSWWGILGIIGWTYLAASIIYLVSRGNRAGLLGILGLMIAFDIGLRHGGLDFLKPIHDFVHLGNIFGGHASIVTAGMVVGTLFTPAAAALLPKTRITFMALFGAGLLASGYLLRPLHGFSKINATESWCLATSGICCLFLLVFYWLMDVLKIKSWAGFLRPIGTNPLLAYILPDIVGSLFGLVSSLSHLEFWRILTPYWEKGGWPGMLNAAVMTGIILLLTWALTRKKIILKI
jgi:predicted acyltransferase